MDASAGQIELRKLPNGQTVELTKILEINQDWEKLMSEIREDYFNFEDDNRKYTSDDINSIRQASLNSRRPCSELFLEEWYTSGKRRPTVRLLFEYLKKVQLWRAADFISEKVLNEPIPERPKDGPARTVVLTDNSSMNGSATFLSQSNGYYGSVHNRTTKELKPLDDIAEELLNCLPGDCVDEEAYNDLKIKGIGSNENDVMPVVNGVRMQVNKIPYEKIKLATNNFDLTQKLGWGAFGKVYRGNLQGTEIAIKVLNKFGAEHFEREMLVLLQRVDHVNLLPPMAVSDDGGVLCLVYKFMSKGSLEERLACKMVDIPPLTEQQRVLIAHNITAGLHYLHSLPQPIIHRDIKTSNILLDENDMAKIADFGLIRVKQSLKTSYASVIQGTDAYMAPEAHRGNISPKMDVYSFGIVLLEIVTGLPVIEENREHIIEYTEDEVQKSGTIEILLDMKTKWNVNVANELYKLAESCLLEARQRPTIMKANEVMQRLLRENC